MAGQVIEEESKMKYIITLIAVLALLLSLPLAASAASVGKVTHIEGRVDITSPGQTARPVHIGDVVNQGDIGELLLKGPYIFSGYWDEPEETKKTIEADGWVHTGDLANQDEEGFYYIVGRKKEMFISGGENIYPVEIEELIYQHPAIDLAAVIGVPDEKWGEVGKAILTLKPGKSITAEELREFLKPRLAKYKIPRYFEIRDSLPTSAAGKILKREL